MDDLDTIAARHGFPLDAAQHLREALARGNGRMAQFNHPALGGMGQWHAGGMMMIGDMFNDGLKARVDACLRDLVPLAASEVPAGGPASASGEWPSEFGAPSTSGSQNAIRYAFFPDARRLMIVRGDHSETYDTADHMISGVSQQQGNSSDLAFTSQHGPVRLSDLAKMPASALAPEASPPVTRPSGLSQTHADVRNASAQTKPPLSIAPPSATVAGSSHPSQQGHYRDDLATLERLAELHRKHVLTDEEFATKKAEILARL